MSETKFSIVAKVAQSDILPVIEGLAVDQTGYFLSEEQMTNVEAALLQAEQDATAAARVTELENQLQTAQAAQKTAEDALATANDSLKTAQDNVATLEAKVAELSEEDAGGSQTSTQQDKFSKETTDAMEMDFQKQLMEKI